MLGLIKYKVLEIIYYSWKIIIKISLTLLMTVGLCSSVDIATGYGLDGSGIESRWRRDFPHLSTSSLGLT